ncbi:hypothetical protein [Sphingobacterium sp. ML3W]|nr:hypothetical protein [Sphingobacterium sp. ML3W]
MHIINAIAIIVFILALIYKIFIAS